MIEPTPTFPYEIKLGSSVHIGVHMGFSNFSQGRLISGFIKIHLLVIILITQNLLFEIFIFKLT
jgi:hypothetical protein